MNPADPLTKLQSILKERNLSGWNMSMGKYEVDWIKNGVVIHIPTSRGGVKWQMNEISVKFEEVYHGVDDLARLASTIEEAKNIIEELKKSVDGVEL